MSELPEVTGVNHQILPDTLLKPGVVLVAGSGPERHGGISAERVSSEAAHSGGARQQQILVIRRFEGLGVGDAQHCPRALQKIRSAEPGFDAGAFGEAIVLIHPEPPVQRKVAEAVRVLDIKSELIDLAGIVKVEEAAAASQVVGKQAGLQVRVG